VVALRESARRSLHTALVHGRAEVAGLAAQVRALSPAATLDRGYAVVRRADGHVVRDAAEVNEGDALRIRVALGELAAQVVAP
jgi:exodeoxyribonuclease VII large subunit